MSLSLDEWVQPTVDPEVRAYVYSLVSAVGGSSTEEDGRYVLGDDALACLKDLRRWIRFYDQRLNRYDVVRCLAEANLVKGDLLEILAAWPEQVTEERLKHKIALACLELLVPLTWPLDPEPQLTKVNHLRHIPYLKLAQAGYKRAILQHPAQILRTAVRIALPSMAEPRKERSQRDEGIIRIVLYFLRDIAMISHPPDLPADDDQAEISRSATIDAFHYQDIFQLLLTVASSMGDEFVLQDVMILEILFYLVKGVNVEKLFMEEERLATTNTQELKGLIQKEKAMLAGYARHAPTRHNRFGTMIWVKRDDEKVSTVSGQDVLGNVQKSLQKMDKTKKWNKPRQRGPKPDDVGVKGEVEAVVPLTGSARKHLRAFVEEFLDSSFNPLFSHLRKAIERETERVEKIHSRQYFYVVSWFLEAERARREHVRQKAAKANGPKPPTQEEESFSLIAAVMNQETFVLMNRFMQTSMDDKQWQDLNAGMRCFTQILLMVQEMSDSPLDDDQEIAENILNRIFYEETTHDRVIAILRNYKDQGFSYLDGCTELAHVFLRMLERYSKQNVDLHVRSRRRARTKRKAAAQAEGVEGGVDDERSEAEDVAEAQRTVTERKFDFARFSARFMTQNCVNTFVAFTRFYNDLSPEQLKRAHRFFYRVAFKMELGIILYRVDILQLFNKIIKGPEGLPPDMPAFKEWEELVRQIFRRVIKKVQERPELVVEMLFSKINATVYYLEHGHDKEMPTRAPRAPAELEIKPGMDKVQEIGVAVSVLVNQNKSDALSWIKQVLSSAAAERRAWQDAEIARKELAQLAEGNDADQLPKESSEPSKPPSIFVKPDNEERRLAMFKDNKLRLLMKLLGFERLGLPDEIDASWIIPSNISASELTANIDLIHKTEFDPPTFEDGKSAEYFLRNKAAAHGTRRGVFDDDSEADSQDEEDFLFPAGGPTARKSDALEQLKQRRRRRRRSSASEPDEEEKERRRQERNEAALQRRKKIKSAMYVNESDDETDEEADKEFFAKEEQRRRQTGMDILKAIAREEVAKEEEAKKRKPSSEPKRKRKKRKASESASENSDTNEPIAVSSSRSSSVELDDVIGLESEEDETIATPFSSQARGAVGRSNASPKATSPAKIRGVDAVMADAADDDDDEEDEDNDPVRSTTRRAVRAGFVIESDSE